MMLVNRTALCMEGFSPHSTVNVLISAVAIIGVLMLWQSLKKKYVHKHSLNYFPTKMELTEKAHNELKVH